MASFETQVQSLFKDLNDVVEGLEESLSEIDDEIVDELQKTHSSGDDPNGNSWPSRKHPSSNPILIKTGNLLNSYNTITTKNTIRVENTADYAPFVNNKRKLLPEVKLPDSWFNLFEDKLDKLIREFNRKK
jgi:hypothetical protein